MALSDYVQIVFNKKGETIPDCTFTCGELTFEAYKNWLYINSEKHWEEKSGFSRPTIGQVSGNNNACLFGVQIYTSAPIGLKDKRGILYHRCMMFYVEHEEETFAGVCAYAYKDYERYLARKRGIPDDWEYYTEFEMGRNTSRNKLVFNPPFPKNFDGLSKKQKAAYRNKEISFYMNSNQSEAKYCGITQDHIKALAEWLKEEHSFFGQSSLMFRAIETGSHSYSNQGNRFFKDNGVGVETECAVGETAPVLAHEMIKNMKKGTK